MRQPHPESHHFQELDPEPAQSQRGARQETWVALALIAAVSLLALGNWWNHGRQAAQYRDGVSAVMARHWAEARDAFTAAGGYADAPARAAAAADLTGRLETGYATLQAALAAEDWLPAWHQARDLAAMQPDYRDASSLASRARIALFGQGAAGTVYLQTDGDQPGLYLITTGGYPVYLPGSTATSRVRAVAPDGARFLYDAFTADDSFGPTICEMGLTDLRAEAGIGPPLRTPVPRATPRLILATLGSAGPPSTMLVPPSFDPEQPAWFTEGEVAALDSKGRLQRWDPADTIGLRVARAPVPPGARILAVAAGAGRVLLATNSPAAEQATRLLISGRASAAEVEIPGFVLHSQFSPDGRYSAVVGQEVGAGITRTLYLLDAEHPETPRVLDRIAWQGIVMVAYLRASFAAGPTPGIVVERQDEHGTVVSYYPLPAGPGRSLWSSADVTQHDDPAALSPDGRFFTRRVATGAQSALAWVPVAAGEPSALPMPIMAGQMVDPFFAPGGGYLLARVCNPAGLDQGSTEEFYVAPLPVGAGARPAPLAVARRVYDPDYPSFAVPPGGTLAVFIAPDGALHARPLDGSADQVLAPQAEAVWALPLAATSNR
ncbi:MAG TPA: hypothetical protein VM536_12965 [Chloroflexia bacterium]|nr:hypothetical protein [Chloroflexia bacterium]